MASASDSDGTVTNVQFFQGTTSLGNVTVSPYAVTVSNLLPGDHSLSAVATDDGGLSTTNTITVHVTAPFSISATSLNFSPPAHFRFTYGAIIGRSYMVLRSTDLVTWIPIATNSATSISVPFEDTNAVGSSAFYRVQLLPNQ
jgi:hypothetical protein